MSGSTWGRQKQDGRDCYQVGVEPPSYKIWAGEQPCGGFFRR